MKMPFKIKGGGFVLVGSCLKGPRLKVGPVLIKTNEYMYLIGLDECSHTMFGEQLNQQRVRGTTIHDYRCFSAA